MSPKTKGQSLIECLGEVSDPRIERCRRHKLVDILFISVCATISGADSFTEMEEFGRAKEAWLRQFLELPNGIPSHDTIGRVLGRLKPDELERSVVKWVQGVVQLSQGEIVPMDGKTVRRSHNRAKGQAAIEVVSAWARSERLTLGQVKVAEESNEITAVPELLRLLEVKGCLVTLDALNTQKEIVSQIREEGADYVVALRGNHPTLLQQVAEALEGAREGRTVGYQVSTPQTLDGEHGRIETRHYWQMEAPESLHEREQWRDLQSIGLVEATRDVGGQVSTEVRYYLSSLPVEAVRFGEAVRGRWGIENSCHWILDLVFREDDSRVRTGYAAENVALIRRIALNLLQQEKTLKRGIKTKRLKAALDDRYLLKILTT
ncbi:MAG: ISAs1 family transposase [candidate division WOR-3 bacterium]